MRFLLIRFTLPSFLIFLFVFLLRLSCFAETVVLGDLEGQWRRLESFLVESEAFERRGDQWLLKNGYEFVFIGDVTDHGAQSLQILKTLIQIKENSPEQVHYILGNRDINKLRLNSELSVSGLRQPPNERVAKKSYAQWLQEFEAQNKNDISKFTKKELRLRWILECTMAARDAFRHRQTELAQINPLFATNDDVIRSFESDFEPEKGLMAKYLQLAKLAHVDSKNRTLFVHGGLSLEALGRIPGKKTSAGDLRSWLQRLNSWAQFEIRKSLREVNYKSPLIQYQEPNPGTNANPASIVYHRNFDSSGNPIMIPEALQEYLLRNGIDTLIVGHTPVGETPFVIANEKFRIVFADTSAAKEARSAPIHLSSGSVRIRPHLFRTIMDRKILIQHDFLSGSPIGFLSSQGRILTVVDGRALTMKITYNNKFEVNYFWIDLRKNQLCAMIFKK